MKNNILFLMVILCLTFSGILNAAIPAPLTENKLEQTGTGKLLADWIEVQLFIIGNTKVVSHNVRQSAYTAIAFYEAIVKGDPQYRSLAGQLNGLNNVPEWDKIPDFCWQASGNAAFADMFRYFYSDNPVSVAKIDSMEIANEAQFLKEGYSQAVVKLGSEYGKSIAKAIIDWSKTDGDDKSNAPYTIPTGLGFWEPTPPNFTPPILAYMGNDRTLVKGSIENAFPTQPLAFSTDSLSPFYKMVYEVFQIGNELDNEKKSIALFWDDTPNVTTKTGGGHWASIFKDIILTRNLSIMESAHIYAEMFITMNDAVIDCFKAKYTYNLLRPVTYIQKYIDADWNSFIVTPPHPEYTAAHAVVSMSASVILTHLLGNNVGLVDHTYDYKGYSPRRYNNFIEVGTEAGMSRLYGGIHYRPSVEAGFVQGKKIADNVINSLVFKN